MGSCLRAVLGLSPKETLCSTRGFRCPDASQQRRIETIGWHFLEGYHLALESQRASALSLRLNAHAADFRGFVYEGAAMALGILDRLTPWRASRVAAFLTGPGAPHTYMIHVALGWVAARFPGSLERQMRRLDPVLRWLLVDGYGFHEGYFHWRKYLQNQPRPRRVKGYAERAFDQGLGRSLWFIEGGTVPRIADTISRFSPERRADLWSGIGLASVYAGEVDESDLYALVQSAGGFRPQLAQGAAFAAKARLRAGNPTEYTERACQVLCGRSAVEAALVTDDALENLPADGDVPAYEVWRQRIQRTFAHSISLKP